jgi:neutral ceramidase
MRGHFRAGFATADITPDPASRRVELSGYVLRQPPATAVRDPIEAAVLALSVDDEPPKLLVSLDLCALDEPAARRIAGACPVPDGDVLLTCTHTHSAPAVYPLLGCGEPDPTYVRTVARQVGDAARRALAELAPCRLGWGTAVVEPPLWGNRRDPAGPRDLRVRLLKVERAESHRAPVAAVWSVACHPVVLGPENTRVSADFVGVVRAALGLPSLMLQGFSGDQNPCARGEEALGAWTRLAEVLRALWDRTPTAPSGAWGYAEAEVSLPRAPGDPREEVPAGPPRVAEAMRLWAERVARPGEAVPPARVSVRALRVGGARLVFWSGEPFASLAADWPTDVVAVGHAGPSVGYVPDAAAYRDPGYEAGLAHRYYGFPSALAPEASSALRQATERLLAELV